MVSPVYSAFRSLLSRCRALISSTSGSVSDTADPQPLIRLNRRGSVMAVVLLTGITIGTAAPAFAQDAPTPSQIAIRLDKAMTGRYLFWFTSPAIGPSPPRPLPAANPEGSILLDLPAVYNQPEAQVKILDGQQGKIAHLPIRVAYREPFGPNLLQNADFASGLDSWRSEMNKETAKGSLDVRRDTTLPPEVGDRAAHCIISAIDNLNWHVQFIQTGLPLEEGELYTLTFWAKADRERPMALNTCVDLDDFHNTGLDHKIVLKTEWRKYLFVFTPTRTIKGQNRVTFILGDTLGTVDLAGIALRRGAVVKSLGTNLLKNGDFAQGLREWAPPIVVAPAAAKITIPSAVSPPAGAKGQTATFAVAALGKENWMVHLYQAGIDIQEGEIYTVTFWAKADRKRPLSVNASVDKEDFRRIGLDSRVSLDTTWHKYALVFTATRTVKNSSRLVFAVGDALGTVDLADISLRAGVESTVEEVINRPATLITAADFKYSQTVKAPVKFQGRSVHGLLVTLKQKDKALDQYFLKPGDQGMARFTDVPLDEKLTLSVEHGGKTVEFTRILAPDTPGLLGQVDLPETWTGINTLAGNGSQHPLIGTWENVTTLAAQRYRFTFNADGTGSIQPAAKPAGNGAPQAPPANAFRWYLKEEGARLIMSTKNYEWAIRMEGTDQVLTLKEKNGKTITMRRR